jgi:hypothetical protein
VLVRARDAAEVGAVTRACARDEEGHLGCALSRGVSRRNHGGADAEQRTECQGDGRSVFRVHVRPLLI